MVFGHDHWKRVLALKNAMELIEMKKVEFKKRDHHISDIQCLTAPTMPLPCQSVPVWVNQG
jgi:hypothetical protein